MERTTIALPRELVVRLRALAAERHTSVADLISDAIEENARPVSRPKPHLGIFDSGYTDTSEIASQGPVPPVSWR